MAKNNIELDPEMEMTLAKVKIIAGKNDEPLKTNQQKIKVALNMLSHLIDFTEDSKFLEITDYKK